MFFGTKRRKRSLYLLMLILLILACLTPVIGSMFLFLSNVWDQQAEQAEASARFYAVQLFNSSTISMNTLQSAAEYLISEGKIRAVMTADPGTPIEQNILQDTLGQMILFDSAWQTANISSLYVFRNDGASFSLYGSDKYDSQYRRISSVYEEYRDFSSARTLVPGEGGACYFVLDYTDYHTHQVLGKIIFEVKISALLSVNALRSAYPSASVVLSTTDGELLTNQSVYSNNAVNAALSDNRLQSYESTDELNGEMHFHRRQRVSGYNLYIDVYLPQDEVFGSLRSTAFLFIGSLSVLLILICSLSVWASRMLFAPIYKITNTMGRMADGDLSIRMEEQTFRETEQIATAFNGMADHLEALYQDAYEKGVRLRATEYQLLEAQINPHFIFNVLETVNMRCLAAGHRDIAHIVTDLAELLRFNLRSHKNQKITFSEELRYVRYYLDLQKARFHDALAYEIDY
ncbi:MAG: histidine kinase, partial [Butyricicoccus sp.]|nr:histidine kinase [Butyricicoccus sp.]